MDIILVLGIYGYFLLTDILPAIRTKKPLILWPSLVIFCTGFVVQCLYEMKINVFSPSVPISEFFSSLFGLK